MSISCTERSLHGVEDFQAKLRHMERVVRCAFSQEDPASSVLPPTAISPEQCTITYQVESPQESAAVCLLDSHLLGRSAESEFSAPSNTQLWVVPSLFLVLTAL